MERIQALPFTARLYYRTLPGETQSRPFYIADRLAARVPYPLAYPLFYTDIFAALLCPVCANRRVWKSIARALRGYLDWGDAPVASYVHWTGAPAYCSECRGTLSPTCGEGDNT